MLGKQFNVVTSSCSNCSAGTVRYNETQTSCSNCPERSISDARNINCVECGSSEISRSNVCSNCPENMFVDGNTCASCERGNAYIEGECKPCEIGTFYDDATLTCQVCGLGRTTESEGSIGEAACICGNNKFSVEGSNLTEYLSSDIQSSIDDKNKEDYARGYKCLHCPGGTKSDMGSNNSYTSCYCVNPIYGDHKLCPPYSITPFTSKCPSGFVTTNSKEPCSTLTTKTEIDRDVITGNDDEVQYSCETSYLINNLPQKYVFWSTMRRDMGCPLWNSPAGYFIKDDPIPDGKILDYGLSSMRSFNVLYESDNNITQIMRYGAYTKLHFMVFRDHLPTLKLNGSPNTYTLKSISGETYLGGTYGTKVANMMFYTD